jgi:hypothetical protein
MMPELETEPLTGLTSLMKLLTAGQGLLIERLHAISHVKDALVEKAPPLGTIAPLAPPQHWAAPSTAESNEPPAMLSSGHDYDYFSDLEARLTSRRSENPNRT